MIVLVLARLRVQVLVAAVVQVLQKGVVILVKELVLVAVIKPVQEVVIVDAKAHVKDARAVVKVNVQELAKQVVIVLPVFLLLNINHITNKSIL